MSSSRRRLYLDLGSSFLTLFKTQAYYLKELTGKQSILEKPYLDQDYRKMHLNLKGTSQGAGGSEPSPTDPRFRYHTFQFAPGHCWVGSANAVCGEEFEISLMIVNIPPQMREAKANFSAGSSNPTAVQFLGITSGMDSFSANARFKVTDSYVGTVTICASASLSGQLLKEFKVKIPLNFQASLALATALGVQKVSESYYDGIGWPCGCVDVAVSCGLCDDSAIAWNSSSAETIARNGSASVAILDPLGNGGPYSWSVSGTGFTLTSATTTGLSNTLQANSTACGSATITVTGCGGNTAVGYVRCTTGRWVSILTCTDGLWVNYCMCEYISGKTKINSGFACGNCFGDPPWECGSLGVHDGTCVQHGTCSCTATNLIACYVYIYEWQC